MTAKLLRLDIAIEDPRNVMDLDKLRSLIVSLKEGDATQEVFQPGSTYQLLIDGSSANYTLVLNDDGKGSFQRTVSKPGSQHLSYIARERQVRIAAVPEEKGGQDTQIFQLQDEPFVMPIIVGTPQGVRLRGIFSYISDKLKQS